jgi:hypothetical protein
MLERKVQESCGKGASYSSLGIEEPRETGHTIFCTADSTEISNCLTRNGHELRYPVLPVANKIWQVWHSTVAIIKIYHLQERTWKRHSHSNKFSHRQFSVQGHKISGYTRSGLSA